MRRKKDYQKKIFKNPQFPKRFKDRGEGRPIFLPILFAVLLLGTLFFLAKANFLQITQINVEGISQEANEGIKKIAEDQLGDRSMLFFSQGNILFFDKSELRQKITDNYFFEDIKVKKKLFHTLEIVIDQKALGVIWSTNNDQYYLDLDGIAIRKLDNSDLNVKKFDDGTEVIRSGSSTGDYPLVYDQAGNDVVLGKPVTSDQLVKFVVLLSQAVVGETDIVVSHFYLERPFLPEVSMVTKEGWEAKFKINDDPFRQIELLNSVLGQKVQNRKTLQYIDLRFGERIFYK